MGCGGPARFVDNNLCPLRYFSECEECQDYDFDDDKLTDFATDIVAEAPFLAGSIKSCSTCDKSTKSMARKVAREYADDAFWEEGEFVSIVGCKAKKRKRASSVHRRSSDM